MSMRHQHIQKELRNAIAMACELERHELVKCRDWISVPLAELETELMRIEAKLGGPHAGEIIPSILDVCLEDLGDVLADAGPVVGDRIRALMRIMRRLEGELRQLVSAPAPGHRQTRVGR